jgi:hypothetical protein
VSSCSQKYSVFGLEIFYLNNCRVAFYAQGMVI